MGVNAYFGPRQTNGPHATPNYGTGKSKIILFITDIHIFSPKQLSHI